MYPGRVKYVWVGLLIVALHCNNGLGWVSGSGGRVWAFFPFFFFLFFAIIFRFFALLVLYSFLALNRIGAREIVRLMINDE
jgi:hypothetical protein